MKEAPDVVRYVRVDDYASRVDALEFSAQVWKVFGQLDQARSVAEVAGALQLTSEVVEGAFRRLHGSEVIRKHTGSLAATSTASSGTLAKSAISAPAPAPKAPSLKLPSSAAGAGASGVAKSGGVAKAGSPPAVASPASVRQPLAKPVSMGVPVVFLRLASDRAVKFPEPTVKLRLGRYIEPDPAYAAVGETAAAWKLKPVLDAIGAKAGGGLPGQMLVYKVFLQLPPDLLKEAGLQSLSVVDDKFTLSHPILRNAIVDAARRLADVDVSSLMAAA